MKILVAEDDRVFQVLLGAKLGQWGYEVTAVENGEEAWKQLSSHSGPRLAILDWMMPKMNGPEVCRKVRGGDRPHYVYMILLTGKTNANDLVAGLEAGADDYISKPVRFNELRLRLRSGCRVVESQERQRVFAETASDGVIILEAESGTIQFANSAAALIFRCPAGDLVGRRFQELVPEFRRRLDDTAPRSDLIEDFRTWAPIEMSGQGADGSRVLLELSFSCFEDHDRKEVLTAVIRDVTRRKLLERQLAQAQRLESIGQLAAGVAHEINTPIQYIGDNTSFLDTAFHDLLELMEPRCPADKAEATRIGEEIGYLRGEIPTAIHQMSEGVEQVARIVRAMKEFSHPGPLEKVPTDLNRAIESTVLISRNEWKYCAEVTTDLDPNLPPVPCIGGEFNQVILNLIVNSAHAIKDVVQGTERKGTIHIVTRKRDDWAEIQVRDDGAGIPEEIQSKVFDPFFTTKEVGKGTGQGLAIARSVIVQKHRGSITFESKVGAGTTFSVRLPLGLEGLDTHEALLTTVG